MGGVAAAAGAVVVAVVGVVAVAAVGGRGALRVRAAVLLAPVVVQIVEGQLPHALLHGLAVEEELHVDAPVRGGDDGRAVGAAVDLGEDPLPLGVAHAVGLVDDDQVGDAQMPVDLGVPLPGGVELGGVDDLHEAAVHDVGVLAGEHHPHELLRLREPARLDDDDVDAGGGAGEPLQVLVELTGVHGTAEAAVAERDGGVAERSGDSHGVDLDGPEVVDDRADPAAAAAVEQVVQECRLPRAEKAREYDNRNLLLTHVRPLASTRIKLDQVAQDAYTSRRRRCTTIEDRPRICARRRAGW
ncbi:putative protein CobW [Streptomyces aurantiacus JA 4570]|uniref:Uncharacterized protein n=1 Tax=Streptomyces aurantiacus JA 4570 TaxID=1286094 RepID=S4AP03_9ACTN|nr:putative protein CobW [Streptomyces aurantiacus JA 4570]